MKMTQIQKDKYKEIVELTEKVNSACKQLEQMEKHIKFEYLPLHCDDMDKAKYLMTSFLDDVDEYSKGLELVSKLTLNYNREKAPYFRNASIKKELFTLNATLYDDQILFEFLKDNKEIFSLYYWYKSSRSSDFYFYKLSEKNIWDKDEASTWIQACTDDFITNLQDYMLELENIYIGKTDEMCDFINQETESYKKEKGIFLARPIDIQKDFIDLF